ncbi:MAG: hypothetical protein SFU27_02260 [Thermonemataceae bacterium]|nr:hypothetical protein [Thermonemataceae bacterium]
MKKIIYFLSIFAGGLFIASCEKSAPIVYNGEKFVHFEDTLLTISESSAKEDANGEVQSVPSMATIRINRATSDISQNLSVSFKVTAKYVTTDTVTTSPTFGEEIELGDVPAGAFYLSSPSAVNIKAGEAFAFVTLTAVNNEDVDGKKKITLELESTSDASFTLGYPGPDKKNLQTVVYVNDDDCPFDINDYVGNLAITDELLGASVPNPGSYIATSTQVGPTSIAITNLFDAVTRYPSPTPCPVPVVLVFNTVTSDVVFSPARQVAYYRAGTCPGTSNPREVYGDPAAPMKVNTCEKTFTINYYVINPTATAPFDFAYSTAKKQ